MKNISCWRDRVYRFSLIKYCVEKKFDVTCISTKPPDQSRKVKKVKYIYSDISNKKLTKKIKSKYSYVINLGGYVDHSNIKKLTIHIL